MKVLVLSDVHIELLARPTGPRSVDCDAVALAIYLLRHGHNAKHWAKRGSAFGGNLAILMPGVLDTPGKLAQARSGRERAQ